MAKIDKNTPGAFQEIKGKTLSELIALFTSSFGLIAALAWNEVAKEIVNNYIKPFFGASSGLISLLFYAVFVTILAVIVTFSLTKFVKKN
jgi:Family of unknown function (DUF5654)